MRGPTLEPAALTSGPPCVGAVQVRLLRTQGFVNPEDEDWGFDNRFDDSDDYSDPGAAYYNI